MQEIRDIEIMAQKAKNEKQTILSKERIGDWCQTHSGVAYWPLDPREEEVEIKDIAHALSMICRFNGHCQEFYCPTPEQKILTEDLKWVEAGDLAEGRRIIGFDEFPTAAGSCGKKRRRFRPSEIIATKQLKRKVYRLEMEDGSTIKSSLEHPWLVATKMSRNQKWLTTEQIIKDVGDGRKRYMHKFVEPWTQSHDWDSAWLAGIYDGEGYLSIANRKGMQMGVAQKPGIVYDKIIQTLHNNNFKNLICTNTGRSGCINIYLLGGWRETARLLGSIRPIRLLEKFTDAFCDGKFDKQMDGKKRPLRIIKTYNEGIKDIIGIETSTHTYLCEGFGAHNSVAQHCVYVCNLISERLYKHYFSDCRAVTTTGRTKAMAKINLACKYGLAHDFAEAYVNDLPRPIKREIDGYKNIEALNEQAIFQKFGLEYPMPKEIEDLVKWADNVALATEARDLMAPPPQPWNLPEKPDNKIVVPMTQQEAKAKFLETFYGLFE